MAKRKNKKVDHTYRDFSHVRPEDELRLESLLLSEDRGRQEAEEDEESGSSSQEESPGMQPIPILSRRRLESNFPAKLHEILSMPEHSGAITWMPHGRAWRVIDKYAFVETIAPQFFKLSKYSSFTRQVNGWGFKLLTRDGRDQGAYYHELFLQGMPHLTKFVRRPRSAKGKLLPDPDNEPHFYAISELYPLSAQRANRELPAVMTPRQVKGQLQPLLAIATTLNDTHLAETKESPEQSYNLALVQHHQPNEEQVPRADDQCKRMGTDFIPGPDGAKDSFRAQPFLSQSSSHVAVSHINSDVPFCHLNISATQYPRYTHLQGPHLHAFTSDFAAASQQALLHNLLPSQFVQPAAFRQGDEIVPIGQLQPTPVHRHKVYESEEHHSSSHSWSSVPAQRQDLAAQQDQMHQFLQHFHAEQPIQEPGSGEDPENKMLVVEKQEERSAVEHLCSGGPLREELLLPVSEAIFDSDVDNSS